MSRFENNLILNQWMLAQFGAEDLTYFKNMIADDDCIHECAMLPGRCQNSQRAELFAVARALVAMDRGRLLWVWGAKPPRIQKVWEGEAPPGGKGPEGELFLNIAWRV